MTHTSMLSTVGVRIVGAANCLRRDTACSIDSKRTLPYDGILYCSRFYFDSCTVPTATLSRTETVNTSTQPPLLYWTVLPRSIGNGGTNSGFKQHSTLQPSSNWAVFASCGLMYAMLYHSATVSTIQDADGGGVHAPSSLGSNAVPSSIRIALTSMLSTSPDPTDIHD
uniref:Uncharacterized protein n=1 Tax=Lygus hesperus TaxID=30085 RepID=A0A146KJF3_LYGHE